MAFASGGVACSSDSTSTTSEPPAASTTAPSEPEADPSELTADQLAALSEVAATFGAAEQVVVDAFESETVVPNLERWQEAEFEHQRVLTELRDALPADDCRIAVDELLLVEDDQNAIRLRLIENYRQDEFGLVADDTVEYGVSVVNEALPAEQNVTDTCGRSTVDPDSPAAGGSLTPDQSALFDAVLTAYAATGEAFDAVFSVSEFIADLEALQDADSAVADTLDGVLAVLGEGECRDALADLRALEQQQADLRSAMITAGQSGDLVAMFRTLDEYTEVNSPSEPFTAARQAAVDDCGVEI